MQSIFRYPGGKTREAVRGWILGLRPARVREYREPFVGGGGVFFALGGEKTRWINDRNEGLISVYRALAERPGEFIARCRSIEPARGDDPLTENGLRGGKPQNARLKAEFDRVAFNGEPDEAFRYFFINRTVFGGRVNYDRHSRLFFSNPDGWNVVLPGPGGKPGRLERAAERLRGARVTCGDFEPLFAEPGKDVWIYADPPYYCNTQFHGSSQLYQHSFTIADHRRLAEVIRDCKHNVALSYDDDPDGFIRDLYKGFRIEENTWAYSGSTNAEKDRGRELLILNYDPPEREMPLFAMPRAVEPKEKVEPLTEAEAEELARCEAELDRCTPPPFVAGRALLTIRTNRLYRAEYRTFEAYCRDRRGMTYRRANQLIDSVKVAEVLGNNVSQGFNDRQAGELATLRTPGGEIDPDRVAAMWDRVLKRSEESGEKITARLIREEVHRGDGGDAVPVRPESLPSRVDVLARKYESLTETERIEFLKRIGVPHERVNPVLPPPVGEYHEQPTPLACGDLGVRRVRGPWDEARLGDVVEEPQLLQESGPGAHR